MLQQAIGGLVSGGVYAALGVCVVLMYRMLGVLNFAQAAIGALGACATLEAYVRGVALLPAVLLGVLAGAVLGGVLGWVMARYFLDATIEVRSTVTIGLFVTLLAVGNRILGGTAHQIPDLLGSATVDLGGIGTPVSSLVEVGGAILLAAGLGFALRHSRVGTQLRAMSSRPTTAQLMGVRVGRLTVAVWAFAGAISTLAIMFVLPTSTSNFTYLGLLVVPALAAALLALFKSMFVAALAGLGIGMLESIALDWSAVNRYTTALPFLFIVVVMVWWRRGDVWSEAR
jgi:branched-chain amino acid transport system permease protein